MSTLNEEKRVCSRRKEKYRRKGNDDRRKPAYELLMPVNRFEAILDDVKLRLGEAFFSVLSAVYRFKEQAQEHILLNHVRLQRIARFDGHHI